MANDVDINGMVSDPDFGKLPLSEQKRALTMADPDFGKLGDADFIRAVQGIKGSSNQPASRLPNAGLAPPASPQVTMQDIPGLGSKMGAAMNSAPGRFVQGLATPSASMLANPIGISQQSGTPVDPNQKFDIRESIKKLSLGNAADATLQELKSLNPIATDKIAAGDYAGGIGQTAGNALLLASGARRLMPSTARSGAALGEVKGAIGERPVNVSAPGNAALRIKEMADAGATMPKVVRDFLNRATNPDKGPITFGEARDFYQSASSKMSAAESARLSPRMKFQLGQFTRALGQSIQQTADAGEQGAKFQQAMQEYRRASRFREARNDAGQYLMQEAKDKLPWLGLAYASKKILYGK